MITRSSFQTFHLFPSLPPELQLHIWSLAAKPSDGIPFGSSYSRRISVIAKTLIMSQGRYESHFKQDIGTRKRFGTRWAMMSTCARSRRLALKCWKDDIEEIDVEGKVKALEVMQAMKKDVLESIEELLKEMRDDHSLEEGLEEQKAFQGGMRSHIQSRV